MFRLFSSPAQIWDAWSTPFAPPLYRTRTLPSSSSLRPLTTVLRSAQSTVVKGRRLDDDRAQVRAELLDPQAGDVAGEVFRMGAEVGHAARGAAPLGNRAPRGLLHARALDGLGEPPLGVFDDDLPDRTK